jgi:hypothetical protein
MDIRIYGALKTLIRRGQKRISPYYIMVKMTRVQNKERKLKVAKEKCPVTYKGKHVGKITDLSAEKPGPAEHGQMCFES